MTHWLYLALSILTEVAASSLLKFSDGFSRPWPSLAIAIGYGLSFYCFSVALRTIPISIGYAVWAGLGIVGIGLIDIALFGQKLDGPALAGIGLVVAGVVTLSLFSNSVGH